MNKKYYYILQSIFILLGITLLSHTFWEHLNIINISLLHLIPVLFVALHGNINATIGITVVSLILFNFLYIPPLYSFSVHDNLHIINFLIFAFIGWFITVQAKKLQKQTKENEIRENLLNIISHDLRTPLSTILGSSTLMLQNHNLEENTKVELLGDIHQSSLRMKRLISNLLDNTRLKNGVILGFDWCDFEDIIGVALEDFSEKQTENFEIKIDDLELFWGDNALLVQLMINLIDNALKYSNDKKRITITLTNYPNKIVIEVWNSSDFIEQKKLENIFEKFYRLEDTNDIIGSGIGLYICKTIVRLHSGNIKASYENEGITINISLPKQKKVSL